MSKYTKNTHQGTTTPAEYFEQKRKSNKVIGIILGALVLGLMSLAFVL
jgi:hypothetical protein